MPVPKAKSRVRSWWKIALIAIGILLAIPPLQVLLVAVWDPPISPMQIQRALERREGQEWHRIEWLRLDQIPTPQIHFIWASEDQAFFQHGGFDLENLKKVMEDAQDGDGVVRGASTITMQCARTVFLWQGRSYVRKALEAYYTFWMELLLSKKRILELYLNHIELGPGVYGLGAAAEYHFGKSVDALTRTQMLALAAILPNPREWSPSRPSALVQRKIRRVERLASRSVFPAKEIGK